MKTLQRLSAALVLTLTLALSIFAGEISTGVAGDITTGVAGEISTGVTATDPATDIFLSLLQSLLALF